MKQIWWVVPVLALCGACSPSDQQRAKQEMHETGAVVKNELHKDAAFVKEETKKDAAFLKEQALKARAETQKGVAEVKGKVKERAREHRDNSDR